MKDLSPLYSCIFLCVFDFLCHRHISVSYTHLDVYKRQLSTLPGSCHIVIRFVCGLMFVCGLIIVVAVIIICLVSQNPDREAVTESFLLTLLIHAAIQYLYRLDVYKRQV